VSAALATAATSVHDPAFLTVAWERVRTNKGARSAGTDGIAPRSVGPVEAVGLLERLREDLRSGCFGRIRCGR
jgi:RNA-directed DNA polymerase